MAASFASDALFVTLYYRPELIGSAPYCADMAETLANRGVHVSVLTARPHYPANEVHAEYRDGSRDSEVLNGVTVERLDPHVSPGGGARRRMLSEGFFLLRGVIALLTGRVKRRRLVISLCPSILTVLLGIIATRRHGRHVAVVHDIQSGMASGLSMLGNTRIIQLMRWLERVVLNRTDLVIVLSAEMKRQIQALGVRTEIEVVPIWVDTSKIYPLDNPGNVPPVVMYSGNFGRKQALTQVISMAATLRDRQCRIRIILRGDGSQASDLAEEAARMGLSNVEFEPLLPADRINEGLAEGDIHLVPQDPLAADFAVPSKVYAIMAAGRPFIATATRGSLLHRLQKDSGGFICTPPDDPEALADAVLRLAEDAALRKEVGILGRRFVLGNYSREKVLNNLADSLVGSG